MDFTFNKKFAWLPTEVWSDIHHRDGCAWFQTVYERDGKCYRDSRTMVFCRSSEAIHGITGQLGCPPAESIGAVPFDNKE